MTIRLEAALGLQLTPAGWSGILARVKSANQRARQVGASYRLTFNDLKRLVSDQGGRCFYCGSRLQFDWELDHKMPLAVGGSNHPENLAASCFNCNRRKRKRTAEEFLAFLATEASV